MIFGSSVKYSVNIFGKSYCLLETMCLTSSDSIKDFFLSETLYIMFSSAMPKKSEEGFILFESGYI